MEELIKITDDGVDARNLWEELEIKHAFRHWISNAIKDYKYKEGNDYSCFLNDSTGGRPTKEYAISIEMAKELSMVCKTEVGRKYRKYFIKCESILMKIAVKKELTRMEGIDTRKQLVGKIKSNMPTSLDNPFSTYTRLAYEICNITYVKLENSRNFRNTLNVDQLKRVEFVEQLLATMIDEGNSYEEIRQNNTILKLFKGK